MSSLDQEEHSQSSTDGCTHEEPIHRPLLLGTLIERHDDAWLGLVDELPGGPRHIGKLLIIPKVCLGTPFPSTVHEWHAFRSAVWTLDCLNLVVAFNGLSEVGLFSKYCSTV